MNALNGQMKDLRQQQKDLKEVLLSSHDILKLVDVQLIGNATIIDVTVFLEAAKAN